MEPVMQPETKENTPLTVSSESNLDIDTDTYNVAQFRSLTSFDEQQMNIVVGSYCYLQMDVDDRVKKSDGDEEIDQDNLYCRVLQIQSNDKYLVIDLTTMKQRIVHSGYVSVIPRDDTPSIESARKLYKRYGTKLKKMSSSLRQKRVRNTKRTIFVMVFLFVFISGLAVLCFWRAQFSLDAVNTYRRERTTQCTVSNYTEIACEYDCNQDELCAGTLFRYEAIANRTCSNMKLWQLEVDYDSCGDRNNNDSSVGDNDINNDKSFVLSIDDAFTCYILDCNQGFYADFVYPPNEFLSMDPTSIVWIVVAFVLLMTGLWCGLYAVGEWIAFLGTDDDKKIKCKKNNKK